VAVIGRIVVVVVAMMAAAAAAGLVVVGAVMYPQWSRLDLGPLDRDAGALIAGFGFVFVSGFALLPGLVVALVAEAFAIRSLILYALGGALVGLAAYLAFVPFDPATLRFSGLDRREIEVMTGAGVVAGFVYWAIAGRRAGAWRGGPSSPERR
jgi:hypothetical protein